MKKERASKRFAFHWVQTAGYQVIGRRILSRTFATVKERVTNEQVSSCTKPARESSDVSSKRRRKGLFIGFILSVMELVTVEISCPFAT